MNKAQKENVQSDNSDDYLFMTCKSNKKERPMSKIKILGYNNRHVSGHWSHSECY